MYPFTLFAFSVLTSPKRISRTGWRPQRAERKSYASATRFSFAPLSTTIKPQLPSISENANRWMPFVWPLETLGVVLSGYRNFELIFKLDEALLELRRGVYSKTGFRASVAIGGVSIGGVWSLRVHRNKNVHTCPS